MKPKKRIGIISYSTIKQDARVLRQIEYLAPHYDLVVVGYGDPPPDFPSNVEWRLFPYSDTLLDKVIRNALQVVGRVIPPAYDVLEISRRNYWKTLHALTSPIDAVLANDLSALPAAAAAAKQWSAKLVFDAHEYSPLEQETAKFKRLETPNRIYLLRKYARQMDAALTVCDPIAQRYQREFGFLPQVVMNAPKLTHVPDHPISHERIRLVHHGSYSPDRGIEALIHALKFADQRFELHFILVAQQASLDALRVLAETVAPGRVFFHPPVSPAEIVRRINEYDLGFYLLTPTSYNNDVALPNKFFDFVSAGLGVVIGPSPSMAQLVTHYGFGCVAASFQPQAAAHVLNALTTEQITMLRANAREAAKELNADVEMAKVVKLFDDLLM